MRSFLPAIIFATVILVVLGNTLLFKAEAVEHHGYKVKDAGLHGGTYSECLECHNEVVAKSIPDCMPVCSFGKSHPLNKGYPPPNKEDQFVSAKIANQAGIIFVDGKIDCITCHNLMINSPKHLRIEYQKKLCSACHIR